MNKKILVACMFGLFSGVASAYSITINGCGNVFPTVDQQGNVTYNCSGTVTPPPPPPPPVDVIKCDGAPNTYVYQQAWGDKARKYSKSIFGSNLNDSDVVVIKLTIPASIPFSSTLSYTFNGGEWQDQGVPRNFKLASSPCVFEGGFGGKSFGDNWYVNDTPVYKKYGSFARILEKTFLPGQTVYFNIKNDVGCYGSCNIFWQFGF